MHLYIGNLSSGVTRADLEWALGDGASIVFAQWGSARASGYAFARIEDPGSAHHRVATLAGAFLKGQRLIVRTVSDHEREARVLRAHGHSSPLVMRSPPPET